MHPWPEKVPRQSHSERLCIYGYQDEDYEGLKAGCLALDVYIVLVSKNLLFLCICGGNQPGTEVSRTVYWSRHAVVTLCLPFNGSVDLTIVCVCF